MVMLESGSIDFEVVDVRRDIGELKLAGSRRSWPPGDTRSDRWTGSPCAGDDGAAWISDFPADGARTAQGLAERARPKDEQ